MAFWVGQGELVETIALKRNFLYKGIVRLNKPVSLSGALKTRYRTSPEVSQFLIHSFEKPSIANKVLDLGTNKLNGNYYYGKGTVGWKDVNIEIYDTFDVLSPSTGKSNTTNTIFDWFRGNGYSGKVMAGLEKPVGNNSSTKAFQSFIQGRGAVDLTIQMIDEDGDIYEEFVYISPIINTISFGKSSYGGDNLPLISMSFAYAAAEYNLLGGE